MERRRRKKGPFGRCPGPGALLIENKKKENKKRAATTLNFFVENIYLYLGF
jgi:hypothetical protein